MNITPIVHLWLSLPGWAQVALIINALLIVVLKTWRNPDTNPIILNIVKIIAIVFVIGWMIRQSRKDYHAQA